MLEILNIKPHLIVSPPNIIKIYYIYLIIVHLIVLNGQHHIYQCMMNIKQYVLLVVVHLNLIICLMN